MKSEDYDIGDLVKLKGVFTDPDTGVGVDPGAVICTVKSPPLPGQDTGVASKPTVESTESGVYVAGVVVDRAGAWLYAFDGVGGRQASGERKFYVREQLLPRG